MSGGGWCLSRTIDNDFIPSGDVWNEDKTETFSEVQEKDTSIVRDNSFDLIPCGYCGMRFGGQGAEHLRVRHHKKCKKKKQMTNLNS